MRFCQRLLGLVVAAATFGSSVPALGQIAAPPVRQLEDANGVDLVRGTFNDTVTDISIGPEGSEGLAFTRHWSGSGWRDSTIVTITGSTSNPVVSMGGSSESFTLSGSSYVADAMNGATLVLEAGGDYVYTTATGTVVRYLPTTGYSSKYAANIGRARSITYPDGTITTFHYKVTTGCNNASGACTYTTGIRVQSVTNNHGYQLKLSYHADEFSNQADFIDWERLQEVKAINRGSDYCDPVADACALPNTLLYASYNFGNALGILYSMNGPSGNGWVYGYNPAGQITGIVGPDSLSVQDSIITYGAAGGKINSVQRPGSLPGSNVATWNYSYVTSGISQTTTASVAIETGTITRSVVANLDTFLLSYATDEKNQTTSFFYDSAGRLKEKVLPESNRMLFDYDARGNVTISRVAAKGAGTSCNSVTQSSASCLVTTANYTANCTNSKTCNKPIWTKDALGRQTDYTYNSTHGGLLTVTAPAATSGVRPQTRYSFGSVQGYYKDAAGNIVASGQPLYRVISISNCLTLATCSNGADETRKTISYGPQTAGTANNLLPVNVTNKSGDNSVVATTRFGYDAAGNRISVDGPLAGLADRTLLHYDNARRLIAIVGPDPDNGGALTPRAQLFTYNGRNQVTVAEAGTISSQSAPLSSFYPYQKTTSTYDAAGRKIKDLVEAGAGTSMTAQQVAQYSYDLLGRIECTALRMNSATWGALPDSACTAATAGTQGPDRISRTYYDAASQVVKVQGGYGTSAQIDEFVRSFTPNGQVATLADAKNNLTTYEYDGFDRLAKTRYPSSTTAGTSSTNDYEQPGYDANSNVTSLRLRDGQSIGFAYDNLNRLVTKDRPGSEPDVSYGYDLLGRLTSASQSGNALSFTYDALGRNLTQSGPLGTVSYQYDLAGRRTRMTWPDGFYVGYTYNNADDLTAIGENGTTTLLTTASYDDLARRTGLSRANSAQTSYAYDYISRLTGLTHDLAGTGQDLTLSFSYNPASQITQATRSNDIYAWNGHVDVNRPYTVNGLNQYTQAGAVGISYGLKGNLISSGSSNYSYNSENYLVSGPGVTLDYDPMGRLYQTTGSATTRFLYDGQDLIGEYDAAGNRLRRYVHGGGTDEPLIWYEGAGTTDRRYLHADERGSIIAVTNAAGNAITINSYDEYGIPASGNAGRFQYTGQTWIPELGMYYYKARIYSPTLGRFMQTDPIGYGDGMNMYAYVGNDPVNFKDPSGLYAGGKCGPPSNEIVVCGAYTSCEAIGPGYAFIGGECRQVGLPPSLGSSPGPEPAPPGLLPPQEKKPPCQSPGPAFRCNTNGDLELDPDYADKACKSYKAMMQSNKEVAAGAGATNLPGLANATTGGSSSLLGRVAKFFSLPGFVFLRGVTYLTTGALSFGSSPPPGCK